MGHNLLKWDESLFRDPDVFEIDYIPDQFLYRDAQITELSHLIRPAARGGRPLNSILKGLPGTGKTTCTRTIFNQIEEQTTPIIPIHINCQFENTRYAVLSQIYYTLIKSRPSGVGRSFNTLFSAIAKKINDMGSVLVVALDDANYLLYEEELNKLLYILLRSHETFPGTRIGVIAIISDMDVELWRELDGRVMSVFAPTEIYFPAYTTAEVRHILEERIQQGFYPNVVSDDVFDLIVETTQSTGDMRVGLDLLKRSGLNAERDSAYAIEEVHVHAAFKISRYIHLQYSIKALSAKEKLILHAIAEEVSKGEDITTGSLFEVIKPKNKIGYTKYYEIVQKLDSMRLVDLAYQAGKGRGRTRLIGLRYEPEKVLSYLSH
jgi:cell division control protein 6